MARLRKLKTFDPTKRFVTPTGAVYPTSAAQSLQVWYDFLPDGIAADSSNNSRNGTNSAVTASRYTPYESITKHTTSGFFDGSNGSISLGSAWDFGDRNAYTFSFWVNPADISGTEVIVQFGADSAGIGIYKNGAHLLVFDTAWTSGFGQFRWGSFFTGLTDKWAHVTITLDRSEAGYGAAGKIKAYKNGSLQSSPTVVTDAAGSRAAFTTSSGFIGKENGYYSSTKFQGHLDSLCVWDKVLDGNVANALYQSHHGVHDSSSGVLSVPAKVLLHEQDARTGSYPTIARTGDPDFTGRYKSTFDDTTTVLFQGGTVAYPTNLPVGSRFLSGGVATPNILFGLEAPGTSSAGISDSHISFTPGENISPFNESRVYIDNDAHFFATGTHSGTLPGFAGRLASKTILNFDISPTEETTVFWGTGTNSAHTAYSNSAAGLAAGISSGLSYFNFEKKKWEIIGDLTTGSNVDYLNPRHEVATGSMLAVCNSMWSVGMFPDADFKKLFRGGGGPTNFAGFPFATKFNSTGSHHLHISSSITAPFLLEKWQLSLSASINSKPYGSFYHETNQNSTFILMLERPLGAPRRVRPTFRYTDGDGGYPNLSTKQGDFEQTVDRRILGYLRVGRYVDNGLRAFESLDQLYKEEPFIAPNCDLWLAAGPDNGVFVSIEDNVPTDGNIIIHGDAKQPSQSPIITPYAWTRGNSLSSKQFYFFGRDVGGRDLVGDLSDGRSFIGASPGAEIDGTYDAAPSSYPSVHVPYYGQDSEISPFLLLPGDKLILAYANQQWPYPGTVLGADEGPIARSSRTIFGKGEGTLTLFGSLLRNNLPVEPESNQPLNSYAVHEDLHYDNPIYDQWDVEPYGSMSGSYVDNVVAGSMLVTNEAGEYGDPTVEGVRQVIASVAGGSAGMQGSLQRFVRLTDTKEQAYDSFPPDVLRIMDVEGKKPFAIDGVGAVYAFSDGIEDNEGDASDSKPVAQFFRAFPFEPRYSAVNRLLTFDAIGQEVVTSAGSTEVLRSFFITGSDDFFHKLGATNSPSTNAGFYVTPRSTPGLLATTPTDAAKAGYEAFFGFGRPLSVVSASAAGPFSHDKYVTPNIRGYKYGLGGLFGSRPDMRFRRDRFGQFRDMLEQRRGITALTFNDEAGEDIVQVERAIKCMFRPQDGLEGQFVKPEDTHCQNLSPFATSSLPYFDGLAVDRPNDPDTLATIEVS